MRKIHAEIAKLLTIFLTVVTISGCEKNETLPLIKFEQVTEFSRDLIRTSMSYGEYGRLSEIQYEVGGDVKSRSYVDYTAQGMVCTIDTLKYEVKLAATIGGSRAFSVSAYKDDGIFYSVEYQFNEDGRLSLARLDKPGENSTEWISYKYIGNNIEINEGGTIYSVSLSTTEENTGYVCNVYAFSEAPLTNKYIIHPELYFFNIYGTPIKQLPDGQTIQRENTTNRITGVGKYHYRY